MEFKRGLAVIAGVLEWAGIKYSSTKDGSGWSSRRLALFGLVALVAASGIASWTVRRSGATEVTSTAGSPLANSTWDGMERMARALIAREGLVISELAISTGNDRAVTLSRVTADEITRARAESLVVAMPGVTRVVNKLIVKQ